MKFKMNQSELNYCVGFPGRVCLWAPAHCFPVKFVRTLIRVHYYFFQ